MDEIDEFLKTVKESNHSLADKYSKVGARWIDADNAARLLEETKTTLLDQRKNALVEANPKMADAHAERQVKADPEWEEWIKKMVKARTVANKLRLALKVLDMRHSEQQSFEATKRAEIRQLG
jgi:hypothetical protein